MSSFLFILNIIQTGRKMFTHACNYLISPSYWRSTSGFCTLCIFMGSQSFSIASLSRLMTDLKYLVVGQSAIRSVWIHLVVHVTLKRRREHWTSKAFIYLFPLLKVQVSEAYKKMGSIKNFTRFYFCFIWNISINPGHGNAHSRASDNFIFANTFVGNKGS